MIGAPYAVNLRSLSDATCDVVFEIIPPVCFVSEEARRAFGANVIHLVCRRADDRDDVMKHGIVEVTHNTPDGYSSIGYAKIASLRYGSGKEIFTQALLTALNGEVPNLYDGEKTPW
jgi:hypothetical protein